MTGDGFTRTTLTTQLIERLRQDIARGIYVPGTMLPSETAMMSKHGVSRTVVRDAIAALTHQGLVRPVQGKGSYVRGCAVPELVITRTPGDPWADLLPQEEPTRRVDNADDFWAARFGIPPESVIYRSEQTMTYPGHGRRFHTIRTLPSPRLEEVGTDPGPDPFQDRAALLTVLAERFGPLYETDQSEPTMPSPDYAALLAVPPGTPLSVVTRLTRTQKGVVLMAETERANAEGLAYAWPMVPVA